MAKILFVDDDSDIRDFCSALLSREGHEVTCSASAREALLVLASQPVDLLITDANMPVVSGFDLISTLRKDGKYPDLTICMLTGRSERKDIELAVSLGVHDYIVKPIDPLILLKKIEGLLEKRPPVEREAEEEFATVRMTAPAKARVAIEVLALSEFGLAFKAPFQLEEGSKLELDFEVFAKIGIESPLIRVLSSQPVENGFETRTAFVGAHERELSKIRAWVHANTLRGRRAA